MLNKIFLFAMAVVVFSSCEDSMVLKSEKKMKKDLQGTWKRDFQGRHLFVKVGTDSVFYDENWIFSDDQFYTTYNYYIQNSLDVGTPDINLNDNVDTAIISKFKVDAKLTRAFLKFQLISGGNDSNVTYIDKWEFVTLKNSVLYLATDNPDNNGVAQREFYKIK